METNGSTRLTVYTNLQMLSVALIGRLGRYARSLGCALIAAASFGGYAAPTGAEESAVLSKAQPQSQISWLKSQKTDFDLVDSYRGDGRSVCYSYDQALVIIAFTAAGEIADAEDVILRMARLQNADGSWYSSYDSLDGNNLDTDKDSGNNSWMAIALNYYEARTRNSQFSHLADKVLQFLEQRLDMDPSHETYGSLWHSNVYPQARSTEHNFDAHSAFGVRAELMTGFEKAYLQEISTSIENYLRKEMWAPSPDSNGMYHNVNVFWVGFNSTGPPSDLGWYTDPQSWGVLSLGATGPEGEEFALSLGWLFSNPFGSTRTQVDYNGQIIDGFGSNTGEMALLGDFIWVEGTEGVAAAHYSIGDVVNGDKFHNEMKKLEQPSGGLIYSFSDVNPEIDRRWPDNYRLEAVNATAWHYFNEMKINPFRPRTPPPIWVDFDFEGVELGTFTQPFSTLGAAISASVPEDTISVKGDSAVPYTQETPLINQAVRLEAIRGIVRIGGSFERSEGDASQSSTGFVSHRRTKAAH